jgi:hypothetical protein
MWNPFSGWRKYPVFGHLEKDFAKKSVLYIMQKISGINCPEGR